MNILHFGVAGVFWLQWCKSLGSRMTTTTATNLRLRPLDQNMARRSEEEAPEPDHNPVLISGKSTSSRVLDLGNGSEVIYVPRFLSYQDSWSYFDYLNKHIPWTRPTIRVFGRSSVQVPPLIHSILLPPPIFPLQLLVLVHTPMKVPPFYPVFSLSLPFFFDI